MNDEARVNVAINTQTALEVDLRAGASFIGKGSVATLDASGSSSADVCATNHLDVDLAGERDVGYSCDPREIDRDVAGGSSLHRH